MADQRRITVLNQSEEFLQLIDVLLEEDGPYQVTTRRMGETSPQSVLDTDPELLIVDVTLGEGRSDGFLQELLAQPNMRGIPVIVTAPEPRGGRSEFQESNPGVVLLPKPFTAPALEELVARLLPEPD
jgi:response regulator RpfG family c-di-GMP phosphodiesterase